MSISARNSQRGRDLPGHNMLRAGVLLSALAGCAVGPDFVPPSAPQIDRYTAETDPKTTLEVDGVAQRFVPGAALEAAWWRLFSSKTIDDVVAEALAANATIAAAAASLRQSQDDLRAGYGVFFPSIEANAAATRQEYSGLKVGQDTPATIFSLFTLSASVSYAIDVFGGERRTIEGLGAAVDSQQDALLAAALTISANVVNTMIAKAAYQAQLKATEDIVIIEREQVKLAEVKARAGTAPYANVLSIESEVDSIEATIPGLQQKIAQADDLLATLIGRTPTEWRAPDISFDDLVLPRDLPVSLPSAFVRQRPDILEAEANLHSASAGVGIATAALLPSLSLNAGYGVNNTATNDLFAKNASYWSFGANIAEPLFDGGTLWFHRKAAIAQLEQARASYRQMVLSAFAQVADTLRALEHDATALDAQNRAVQAAGEALHLVQSNYQAGLADYTNVLIADGQFYQAKISDLEARAQRYQDTVALFVALGGGWWSGDESAHARQVGSNGAVR
jgi:NodT family efflux transporter outer membrane factor (OMF) lipoprotein